MQVFGQFIMYSRRHALCMALLFGALPLMGWLAAVIVGLVTLRHGPKEGLLVMVGAILPDIIWIMLGANNVLFYDVLAGAIFVWLTASGLRRYNSWQWVLQTTALVGVLGVIGVHLWVPDVQNYWLQHYQGYAQQLIKAAEDQPALLEMAQSLKNSDNLVILASMTTGIVVALAFLLGIINLVLARVWQASLFNAGGFRQEFLRLRLTRTAALVVCITLIAALLKINMIRDLLPVLMFPFIIAGLALIHSLLVQRTQSRLWIIGFYGIFFFGYPYTLLVVVLLALFDCWIDFRQRFFERGV